MSSSTKRNAKPTLFAVVCKWADRSGMRVTGEGSEAIVLKAADANEALLAANAARPDLWADDGLFRTTAVHPATLEVAK